MQSVSAIGPSTTMPLAKEQTAPSCGSKATVGKEDREPYITQILPEVCLCSGLCARSTETVVLNGTHPILTFLP